MGCKCEFQKDTILSNEYKFRSPPSNGKDPQDNKMCFNNNNNNHHQNQTNWNLNFSPRKDQDNPHNYSTEYESIPPSERESIEAEKFLQCINRLRETPKSYTASITKYKSLIVFNEGRYYLKLNDRTFINLNKGPEAFTTALEFIDEQKPMHPFKLSNELSLPFPSFEPSLAINQSYLQGIVFDKAKELKDSYDIVSFHYDQMVYDPELAVVLQVVDDTNCGFIRRSNLFSKDAEYIGISGGKIDQPMFCFYYLFANKRRRVLEVLKDKKYININTMLHLLS